LRRVLRLHCGRRRRDDCGADDDDDVDDKWPKRCADSGANMGAYLATDTNANTGSDRISGGVQAFLRYGRGCLGIQMCLDNLQRVLRLLSADTGANTRAYSGTDANPNTGSDDATASECNSRADSGSTSGKNGYEYFWCKYGCAGVRSRAAGEL